MAAAQNPDEGIRAASPSPMRVFVHLAVDKDPDAWKQARARGVLVGLNDETPYGYGRATAMGCEVTFSRHRPEAVWTRLARLGLRALLGFDYVHAWRQRDSLKAADVVWTHTESQHLAVAAVLRRDRKPKLLGQSVWLFDRWATLSWFKRALYRHLLRRVDILTVHSTVNLETARTLLPGKAVALVPFGIPSERRRMPRRRDAAIIKVLAIGSDRHRDWRVLVDAVGNQPGIRVEILSGTADPRIAADMPNVSIGRAKTNAELESRLADATLVCVPLLPNQHASGITVIQEAVLAGVPVIATDTGGLRDYFGSDAVTYVPPQDPLALREAILAVAADPELACARAGRAQARLDEAGLDANGYIRRHVDLSRDLLAS